MGKVRFVKTDFTKFKALGERDQDTLYFVSDNGNKRNEIYLGDTAYQTDKNIYTFRPEHGYRKGDLWLISNDDQEGKTKYSFYIAKNSNTEYYEGDWEGADFVSTDVQDILEQLNKKPGLKVDAENKGEIFNSYTGNSVNIATGKHSHAEGEHTIASGESSHAEGSSTEAIGTDSHAEGNNTKASGNYSHAEGNSTNSLGLNSHAEGYGTNQIPETINRNTDNDTIKSAWNKGSFALAKGNDSHIEGKDNLALEYCSHAEGNSTKASGESSHAEGSNTEAIGTDSHAEGNSTKASGNYSHAEGANTIASRNYSHAEGNSTEASGTSSHSEGASTIADGNYSHAEGYKTTASNSCSHAEGNSTEASGNYSHSEGNSTRASNYASHAEGNDTKADGNYSHAEGYKTTASNYGSHAEGNSTEASGNYSHAEGNSTTASGSSSHAEGNNTKAEGNYSHAEGYQTEASGNYSHTEGYQTEASGSSSHTEGYQTEASGSSSHAEGNNTKAEGNYSHTGGINTHTTGSGSTAIGRYTSSLEDYSFAGGLGSFVQNTKDEQGNVLTIPVGSFAYGIRSSVRSRASAALNYRTQVRKSLHCTAVGSANTDTATNDSYINRFIVGNGPSSESTYIGYKKITLEFMSSNSGTSKQILNASDYGTGTQGNSWMLYYREDTSSDFLPLKYRGISLDQKYLAEDMVEHKERYALKRFKNGNFLTLTNSELIKFNKVTLHIDDRQALVGFEDTSPYYTESATSNNIFRVTTQNVYINGKQLSTNADYAEYFEWEDGNPNDEDRVGRFVELVNEEKIKIANQYSLNVLGIISATPTIVGDAAPESWDKKYLKDIFGRILYDENKNPKINPDYDPEKPYIGRESRPEWSPVGLLGKLIMIDDGTCIPGEYCGPGVNGIATASSAPTNCKVMKRLDDNHIKVFLK